MSVYLSREQVSSGGIGIWGMDISADRRSKMKDGVAKILSGVMSKIPKEKVLSQVSSVKTLEGLEIGYSDSGDVTLKCRGYRTLLFLGCDEVFFSEKAEISAELAMAIINSREALLSFVKKLEGIAQKEANELARTAQWGVEEKVEKKVSAGKLRTSDKNFESENGSEIFESLYKNTNKPLSSVLSQMKKMGYSDKAIYSAMVDILGDLVWEE